MTDAGFVVTGWALTGAVLAGYRVRLWIRARRIERVLPEEERYA